MSHADADVPSAKLTALFVGATGLIGSELVRQLAQHEAYAKVLVLARRDPGNLPENCQFIALDDQCNLTPDSIPEDVDHFFCALGTTQRVAGKAGLEYVDHHLVIRTADLAIKKGAYLLSVVSALGASPSALFHYSRVKGCMEQDLEALCAPHTHIWQPSVLLGDRAERRTGEYVSGFLLGLLPETDLTPVPGRQVAQAMIAAALQTLSQVHTGVSRYKVRDILRLTSQY